mgnify:CR=1 FL=1
MFLNLSKNSTILIIWVIFFSSCASVSAPKGGEIDDIPPKLTETSPKILTDIKPTQKITIKFNEYLDESSLKNAITIFPRGDYDFSYEYRGDKIDLWLPSNLEKDITYMIVFNTNLKDEHNVRLTKDIIIPFSRKAVFDSNTIQGNIFGDFNSAFILLWFNHLDKDVMLNQPPDYVLNASSNSSYKFNFLPEKDFSILAVEQYGSNINYKERPFSFYRKNKLSLKDGSLDNINFYLHKIKSEDSEEKDDTNEKKNIKTATLTGEVSGNFIHPISLILKNKKNEYSNTIQIDGSYILDGILEGEYQLLIYEDRNNNSVFDMGSFTANEFAERFFVYPDSLSLRANWELEIPKWNYNISKEK